MCLEDMGETTKKIIPGYAVSELRFEYGTYEARSRNNMLDHIGGQQMTFAGDYRHRASFDV
jgi:hypothetical protein